MTDAGYRQEVRENSSFSVLLAQLDRKLTFLTKADVDLCRKEGGTSMLIFRGVIIEYQDSCIHSCVLSYESC